MAKRSHNADQVDDVRRRRRQRSEKARPARRKHLVLRILALVVFLLAVAGLGGAAGGMFALAQQLPALDSLERRPTTLNTTIYAKNGEVIAELHGAENRVKIKSAQIPQVMKNATVAVEDERFFTHHGVDPQGIARAMVQNIKAGAIVEGGSTITQQLVKNAYRRNERTYSRKLSEAALAWQLEERWDKDRILTEYLNTVYYGAGAYGVEAASRRYFHTPAKKLNTSQAALLAALPKFPSDYDPTTDPKVARQQRNKVLRLMAAQGYITNERLAKYERAKLGVFKQPPETKNPMADYFTDYVIRVLTKHYGSRRVFEGGLKVYTSVDMKWQQKAIAIIRSDTGSLNFGFKPSAALVAVEPQTGYIRTMVGGLDYKKQKFNLAWQARRQPGSSMKTFVLTTAVLQGMNPDTTYYSSKSPISIGMGLGAPAWVVNGDGPGGPESVTAATKISDNVVFAQLSVDVGPANTVRTARSMGITSSLRAVPSITLGTSEVSPLEMAVGYATLASGGIYHPPQAIMRVVLPNGKVDWKPKTKGRRALPAGVASVVTRVLQGPPSGGGTASSVGGYYPYPRAGKTGTTENGWDVWYVGYTPNLSAAVWMGNARRNSPMPSAFGGTHCGPIWGKFFAAAFSGKPHPGFKRVSWSFEPWKTTYTETKPSSSPSASPSTAATPKPTSTRTITPKPPAPPKPPKPKPPKPKPPKPPKPTPTPTPTPTTPPPAP